MLPTKLNPLGINPYDGVMEFEKVGNLWNREQEILVDTTNNLYIPENINDLGDIHWAISMHGVYTLSVDITLYEDDDITSPKISVYINYNDGTRTAASVNITDTDNNPHRYTVVCTSNARKEINSIRFLLFNGDSYTTRHVKAENIMLSLHGETEYSPYIPNIYRCYGRSTQNQGRNLIPLPDYEREYVTTDGLSYSNWSINNNRIKFNSDFTQAVGRYECTLTLTNGYRPQFTGAAARAEYFLPPGTYTISMHNKVISDDSTGFPALRLTTTAGKTYQVTWSDADGVTFTTEDPIAFAHVHGYNYKLDCEFNIQIEEGTVMTPWKPYTGISIDNPSPIISNYPKGRYKTNLPGITIKLEDDLRSVPCGIADYIEVDTSTKEKSITRQIFKAITTENDSFTSNAEYGDFFRQIPHDTVWGTGQMASNNDSSINTLCTHLKACASDTVNSVIGMWPGRLDETFSGQSARGTQLMFKDPSFIDDNAFRAFLSKGVEINFALAEPITTLL